MYESADLIFKYWLAELEDKIDALEKRIDSHSMQFPLYDGNLSLLNSQVDALLESVYGEGEREHECEGDGELSESQREILLSGMTVREKAEKLDKSVGWVSKWSKKLREKSK